MLAKVTPLASGGTSENSGSGASSDVRQDAARKERRSRKTQVSRWGEVLWKLSS